jgi:hypothetical protein
MTPVIDFTATRPPLPLGDVARIRGCSKRTIERAVQAGDLEPVPNVRPLRVEMGEALRFCGIRAGGAQ